MSRYGQQSGQTCQDFEWIVLFDSSTPERFRTRIADYKSNCPQLSPVFVEPEKGYCFAEIFRIEIVKRLKAERVLSTYLDNDDALNVRFVEDIRQLANSLWVLVSRDTAWSSYRLAQSAKPRMSLIQNNVSVSVFPHCSIARKLLPLHPCIKKCTIMDAKKDYSHVISAVHHLPCFGRLQMTAPNVKISGS